MRVENYIYPRVYPMRKSQKILGVIIGIVLIGAGCASPFISRAPGSGSAVVAIGVAIFSILFGLYVALSCIKQKLILYEDAVEEVGIFRKTIKEKRDYL